MAPLLPPTCTETVEWMCSSGEARVQGGGCTCGACREGKRPWPQCCPCACLCCHYVCLGARPDRGLPPCRGGRELLGKSLEHKMLRPGAVLSWGDWEGGPHSYSPA